MIVFARLWQVRVQAIFIFEFPYQSTPSSPIMFDQRGRCAWLLLLAPYFQVFVEQMDHLHESDLLRRAEL